MILGSGLTHGPKLSSLVCLVAACEDVLGLPSSSRVPGPGVTIDPNGQEELTSLPLPAPPTQPHLGLSPQWELSGGPEMALCLGGHGRVRSAGSSPGTRVSRVVSAENHTEHWLSGCGEGGAQGTVPTRRTGLLEEAGLPL